MSGKSSTFCYFLEDELDSNIVNGNGDYSGGVKIFKYIHEDSGVLKVRSLNVFIHADKDMACDRYGKDITLTNGIIVKYIFAGITENLTDSRLPIMTNGDWSRFGELSNIAHKKKMQEYTKIVINLNLKMQTGDSIFVEFNDDFTDLHNHNFSIKGTK